MKNRNILWITRTAVFLALLIVVQMLTRSLSQYVTGSLVNFILIASVLIGGPACGITAALLSPALAFLAGIGPAFPAVLPVIMLGNLSIVLVWHFLSKQSGRIGNDYVAYVLSAVIGAGVKYFVLWLGVVKVVIPLFLSDIGEAKINMLTAAFSIPQLVTAAIGGAFAIIAVPLIKRAIRNAP